MKPVEDKDFRTEKGGANKPPKADLDKLHRFIPKLDLSKLDLRPKARGSNTTLFNAAYPNKPFQGGTGGCTGPAVVSGMRCTSLLVQGIVLPDLSWPELYYKGSGDRTFTRGSWVSQIISTAAAYGVCLDSLYSQQWLLDHFNISPGRSFSDAELPSAAAYAEAANHKVVKWASVATSKPNIATLLTLIRAGYGISLAINNHAVALIDENSDGWPFVSQDSEIVGDGIRYFNANVIAESGWDVLVCQEIVTTGVSFPPPVVLPPPLSGNAMALSQIVSTASAIDPNNVSQADKTTLSQLVAALVVEVQPPPPTQSKTRLVAEAILYDAKGLAWRWGAFQSDRFGYSLLCNERALKTAKDAYIVNGRMRCYDEGEKGWIEFVGIDAYSNAWAGSRAP